MQDTNLPRRDASTPPLSPLTEASDLPAVMALFTRCADYFHLQDGEPPVLEDARDLFRDVPPGRRAEELVVVGRRGPEGLEAVAALLPGHPGPGIWYLPFMAVNPSCRGRGVGRAFHQALDRLAAAGGARSLQLVVLDSNGGGEGFWRAMGYRALRRVGPDRFKSRWHYRIEMARPVCAHPHDWIPPGCHRENGPEPAGTSRITDPDDSPDCRIDHVSQPVEQAEPRGMVQRSPRPVSGHSLQSRKGDRIGTRRAALRAR